MATHAAMKDIYERLEPIGFNAAFVKSCILPEWWEDKLAEVPSNRQYAESVIARQFGIQAATLRDRNAKLRMRESTTLKLKRRHGASDDELKAAKILGERLAKIADNSLAIPPKLDGLTASSIRQRILDSGAKWVGFHELLDFCWDAGVPVVNLRRVPAGSKKPDGMAVWTETRPVVVIASGRKHPAWHIFIIAHELGHIVRGHLASGELSIDSKIDRDSRDKQEEEANNFAVELLTGDPDFALTPPRRWLSASELARAAQSLGEKFQIDPGFIALSYSQRQHFYQVAQAALKSLQPDANACDLYREPYSHLNSSKLTEDNRHVFESLTQAA